MSKKLLTLCLTTLVIFSGCKDDRITAPDHKEPEGLIHYSSDTSFQDISDLTPQSKILLIQEFTGVYCYTCPLAHGITSEILKRHEGQIAAINIHSHLFSIYDDPKVMGNKYDFRTEDGDTIVSMLGGVLSLPSMAINMKKMPGEKDITSNSRSNWMNYAQNEISSETNINVEVVSQFDPGSRNLKIVAKYHFLEDIALPLQHSIALTESNIIDKQFVDTVVVDDYSHEHILRKIITDPKGDLLNNSFAKGDVIIKVFNYELSQDWNEENIEVVSYVHHNGDRWDVFQAGFVQIK